MNLPYIQSEIFRELMGMETLFKPGWNWFVTRNACRDLIATIMVDSTDTSYQWDNPYSGSGAFARHTWRFTQEKLLALKTTSELTALINSIWDELPDSCKREDILK